MMLKPAPPIQGPRQILLDELKRHLANDAVEDGSPMMRWDEIRGVFLIAVPLAGQIVHWQIEPCIDEVTFAMLTRRYIAEFAETIAALPPGIRAAFRGPNPTKGQ